MTAFKIGGAPIRPAPGAAGGKRTEAKAPAEEPAPQRPGLDTVSLRANPLAVMPRMSVGGQGAQQAQDAAVEKLLKASAAELDDYFTRAYGFRE